MKKIVAVTVAFNRVNLTKEQINSLINQTYKVDKFIIIDNSTNNEIQELINREYHKEEFLIYKKTKSNIGSAKGFNLAINLAMKYSPDFVWIMDDDTIPYFEALNELMNAQSYLDDKKENFSFLASSTFGIDNVAMTVPTLSKDRDKKSGYMEWYRYLDRSIVKIQDATFCSILVKKEAINKVGLPTSSLFMWVEDTEYTNRLIKYYGSAYLIGKSIAIHKRANGKILDIKTEENYNRVKNYYYLYRNTLIVTKEYYGFKSVIGCIIRMISLIFSLLLNRTYKFRFKKIAVIIKASLAFIVNNYDKKGFKNRFTQHEEESEYLI